jgi:hypothetical protein
LGSSTVALRGLGAGASPLRNTLIAQAQGGGNDCQMRKHLREVSYQTPSPRIVLFRQKPNVVPQCQKSLEQCFGFIFGKRPLDRTFKSGGEWEIV